MTALTLQISNYYQISYKGMGRPQPPTLHKKMKFSIKDFFSKCDQIRRKLRIWPHLLKRSLMENFIFCEVSQGKCTETTQCKNLQKRESWLLLIIVDEKKITSVLSNMI